MTIDTNEKAKRIAQVVSAYYANVTQEFQDLQELQDDIEDELNRIELEETLPGSKLETSKVIPPASFTSWPQKEPGIDY